MKMSLILATSSGRYYRGKSLKITSSVRIIPIKIFGQKIVRITQKYSKSVIKVFFGVAFIVHHENLDEMESLIKMCFDLDLFRRPKMKVLTTFISGLYQQKLWNKSAGPLNWNDFKSIKVFKV